MADQRGVDINRLEQETIAEKAMEESLKKAYDLLAKDPAGFDIENSFAIQVEALLGE